MGDWKLGYAWDIRGKKGMIWKIGGKKVGIWEIRGKKTLDMHGILRSLCHPPHMDLWPANGAI